MKLSETPLNSKKPKKRNSVSSEKWAVSSGRKHRSLLTANCSLIKCPILGKNPQIQPKFIKFEHFLPFNSSSYPRRFKLIPSTFYSKPSTFQVDTLDVLFKTLDVWPQTLDVVPLTLDIVLQTLDVSSWYPRRCTLNPRRCTSNPRRFKLIPSTLYPKPSTSDL